VIPGNKILVSFRVSPLELKAIRLLAGQEGMNQSEMLRACIREAATARGIMPLCYAADINQFTNIPEVNLEGT
jgi:hypothetical protein